MTAPPADNSSNNSTRIPVGISACLLGEKVRYDGAHKRSAYCQDILSRYFDFRPVCPEMAIGLGAPRPIIRLVASDAGNGDSQIRAIQSVEPPRDVSAALGDIGDAMLASQPALCGFILTERSPSCGLFHVKTYDTRGQLLHTRGRGLFAQRLTDRLPLLPVEEADRLNDPELRENFVLRVHVWHEWHNSLLPAPSLAGLTAFWTRYRFLVHDQTLHRQIDTLVGESDPAELPAVTQEIFDLLMPALATLCPRGSDTHALRQLLAELYPDDQ